jgi:hypothetical protein
MPYTSGALAVMVNAMGANADRISAHTGDPGSGGANEVTGGTYARKTTAWGNPEPDGTAVGSQVALDIPAATTVTYWGLWTAGGVFRGGFPIPGGSEAFTNAGVLSVTPILAVS